MKPDGTLRIEVPDMGEIMRRGDDDPNWMVYIYGSQSPHAGEFHRSGFTANALTNALQMTGWQNVQTRTFLSEHPYRPNMPCLEATATSS
jgi:hypothetical protein